MTIELGATSHAIQTIARDSWHALRQAHSRNTKGNKPDIVTPAGIKTEFPIYPRAPKHMRWKAKAIKGLVHMVTDKGPQQQWLWEIRKSENPACVCDGWTPQNAAHLQECSWVGDGKGRTADMIWEDEEWCAAVEEFIH